MTQADWQAASAALQVPCVLSIGSSVEDYRAVAAAVDVLVASPLGLWDLLPLESPALKIVSLTWAGIDRLAPFDWVPPGITLLNASGAHAQKGAEYVVMALLMLANRVPALAVAQAGHRWVDGAFGRTLAGSHLTVIGLGAIGGRTATLARALGLSVTGVRANPRPHPDCARVVGLDGLDAVLPGTDFVALALPFNAGTDRLLDARRLDLLPRHAGLVNIGRGRTVDENALFDRLDAGRLGGAVLDVFEDEPLGVDHRAWRTRNLFVTPHMSADDPSTVSSSILSILVDNLNAHARGLPMPNEFDTARGSRARA
jgi:phosphoglycerate dehydrogenase-like enzyme